MQAPEGLQFWAAEGMALATIYRITDLLYMLGSEKLKKTTTRTAQHKPHTIRTYPNTLTIIARVFLNALRQHFIQLTDVPRYLQ